MSRSSLKFTLGGLIHGLMVQPWATRRLAQRLYLQRQQQRRRRWRRQQRRAPPLAAVARAAMHITVHGTQRTGRGTQHTAHPTQDMGRDTRHITRNVAHCTQHTAHRKQLARSRCARSDVVADPRSPRVQALKDSKRTGGGTIRLRRDFKKVAAASHAAGLGRGLTSSSLTVRMNTASAG